MQRIRRGTVDTLAIVQPVLLVAACYSLCSSVCTHNLLAVARGKNVYIACKSSLAHSES